MKRRDQHGQSTVEFALILPIVAVVLLAFVQVGLVLYTQVAVVHTAREVARNVAREPTIDVDQLVAEIGPLSADRLQVDVQLLPSATGSSLVQVSVTHPVDPVIAIFGPVFHDFSVNATMVMVFEP